MWLIFFCLCFSFSQKRTAIFCNPDWSQMAAAVPAIVLTLCRTSELVFYAAFNFILTRVRGEIFPGNLREAVMLLAPMWLMNIICRNLCGAVLVTLRAEKSRGYKLPSTAVPGPRLVGVSRLLEPWSSLRCLSFPLSGLIPVSPNSHIHIYQNKRGKCSLPCFSVLFLDPTTPRSLFLCGLTYQVNVKPRFITIS